MEMLATEYIPSRNTGYMRIVGKSIWENPSHPSRGLIAKPRPLLTLPSRSPLEEATLSFAKAKQRHGTIRKMHLGI
jgi:hypothetical protein